MTERIEMTDEKVEELVRFVLGAVRPTMRRVIGDRTTAQYDKADDLAEAIAAGVRKGLGRDPRGPNRTLSEDHSEIKLVPSASRDVWTKRAR